MLSSQLHRNRPLENISVMFKPEGFIGDMLSPRIMVTHEADTYYVYSKDTLQLPETLRADGAESNRANFNLSTASYLLQEHALKELITERQRRNADTAIKPDIDVTEFLTGIIQTRREVDLATLVQGTGTWANVTSLTSTLRWTANTTTSNPIVQVDSATTIILRNSGKVPNVVAIDDATFRGAKEHTSIVDRVKYTSANSVTPELLARLFNVGRVLVASAVFGNFDEGLTETLSFIWTDTAFIGYVDPAPGLRKVTALATFWQNNTGFPYMVKKWHEDKLAGDFIEVSTMFDNAVVASDCGYLLVDTA